MKIKCISVDIDGTFIKENCYSNKMISNQNIYSIRDYCNSGGKVIFATGRDPDNAIDLFKYLEPFGISSNHVPYIVCLNGSVIIETSTLNTIKNDVFFDEKLCLDIVDFLLEKRVNFFLFSENKQIFFRFRIFSILIYLSIFKKSFIPKIFSKKLSLNRIRKIVVILKFPAVRKFKKLVMNKFGNHCYCSLGPKFYMEISDSKVNKFYGIQEISRLLNIPIEDFAAIGNEQNDVKSLENVGFGAAINFRRSKSSLVYDESKIDCFVDNDQGTAVWEAIEEMKKRKLI